VLGELVKAVLERALEAELGEHLGYARHDPAGRNSGNSRNGKISKTVQTGVGPVAVEVPRDRAGTFEPLLVPKRSGRISGGLDDMIISLLRARDDCPRHPAPPAAGVRHRAVG
jgi:putative transposase